MVLSQSDAGRVPNGFKIFERELTIGPPADFLATLDDTRIVTRLPGIANPPAARVRTRRRQMPTGKCGCSSVVEHLLAKEDVASSSLVTRCPLVRMRRRAG